MGLLDFFQAETPADIVSQRRAEEQRAVVVTPAEGRLTGNFLSSLLDGSASATGQVVSEDRAMRLAAVYASVRVISESIATLPLKLYRKDGRGRERAADHPLDAVLHREANPLMSALTFRELQMVHLLLWGNAFAEIQRDGAGRIVALWPISPRDVTVLKGANDRQPVKAYKVAGVDTPLRADEVFHVAGLGYDGYTGKGPIRMMRETLGIAIAAEEYGAKFFKNDARPGLTLEHPGTLTETAHTNLRNSWNDAHAGSANAWKTRILEEGMTAKTLGLPPGDAQFIETRKYQRSEIASIFRVPPHLIGDLDRATFSNIEHQGLEFVTHTLRPWLVRMEAAIACQLLAGEPDVYAEHNVDALLRGDIASRYQAYATGRQWGWLSANDIRELENLNPAENGDVYLQPMNMVEAGAEAAPRGDGARSLDVPEVRLSLPDPAERRGTPARVAAAAALEPALRRAIGAAVRREVAEIRGAVADHTEGGRIEVLGDWIVRFADEQAEWMEPRLVPVFAEIADAMAEAARDEIGTDVSADDVQTFVRDYARAYARRHAGSTRGQMLAVIEGADDIAADVEARLAEWEEGTDAGTRAERAARAEQIRAAAAITKALWITAGVTATVWRTSGGSCPYCDTLDGAAVDVTRSFVEAGETVGADGDTLTVSTGVSHPPLHRGCDCYLEPSTSGRSYVTAAGRRSALASIVEAAGGELAECRHAELTPIEARDAYIRAEYGPRVKRKGRGVALSEIEEEILSRAESEGWPPIGERQIRRIGAGG